MRTANLSMLTLVAGLVSAAGCAGQEPATGTGGATVPGTGGAATASGGVIGSGGSASGGATGSGGSASGGAIGSGGRTGSGGSASGGSAAGSGGSVGSGGRGIGGGPGSGGSVGSGGRGVAGGTGTGGQIGTGGAGGAGTGTCTASKAAGSNATGSGPHKVTVETNADPGISEGTIFRPTDLGGTEKYPIFVWGEGGCSQNGLSNATAMGEIASHGYFVIADGKPNGTGSRSMSGDFASLGKPLVAYIDWAIAENNKPCSAYYQALDTTKVSSNGFSCGGLMAEGTAGDPRITAWGLNSSGMFSANQAFFKVVHTPALIVLGGPSDIAYENGESDYTNLAAKGIPIMLFSKDLGHGGDLFSSRGGDFTKINLAWLNWHLKGDLTATGKGVLVGSGCTYCSNSAWEVKSMNIP